MARFSPGTVDVPGERFSSGPFLFHFEHTPWRLTRMLRSGTVLRRWGAQLKPRRFPIRALSAGQEATGPSWVTDGSIAPKERVFSEASTASSSSDHVLEDELRAVPSKIKPLAGETGFVHARRQYKAQVCTLIACPRLSPLFLFCHPLPSPVSPVLCPHVVLATSGERAVALFAVVHGWLSHHFSFFSCQVHLVIKQYQAEIARKNLEAEEKQRLNREHVEVRPPLLVSVSPPRTVQAFPCSLPHLTRFPFVLSPCPPSLSSSHIPLPSPRRVSTALACDPSSPERGEPADSHDRASKAGGDKTTGHGHRARQAQRQKVERERGGDGGSEAKGRESKEREKLVCLKRSLQAQRARWERAREAPLWFLLRFFHVSLSSVSLVCRLGKRAKFMADRVNIIQRMQKHALGSSRVCVCVCASDHLVCVVCVCTVYPLLFVALDPLTFLSPPLSLLPPLPLPL